MYRMKKRGLSFFLALSLLLTLTALPVSAAETEDDPLARFSGSGTLTDPYRIATAEDLAAMRDFINTDAGNQSGYYWRQTADIDLSATANWSPIGRTDKTNSTMEKTYRFSGVYDGDGYTISGMTIHASGAEAVGLFGNISRAEIRDLTVEGSITHTTATGHSADYGIGGVVGRTYEYYETGVLNPDSACTLRGVTSRVNITAAAMAGGVVGTTEVDTTFENCVFEGAIVLAMTSEYAYDVFGTGGICGMSQGYDVFTGCVNRGSITCTKGDVNLGGIVGFASNGAVTVIENCYNTGALTCAVTSASTGIGGIVGKRTNGYASDNNETLKMTIRNCYSTGQLTAGDGGTTGGVVGRCVAAAQNGEPIWTAENLSNAYALKGTASYAVRGVTADGKVRSAPGDSETAELLSYQEDMADLLGSAFRTENGALILPWESAAARFQVNIIGIDALTGMEIGVRIEDLDYEDGLAPGRYSFTARKNGFLPVSGSFGVGSSDKTVYVVMTPASYHYTLTVVPADAEVRLSTELDTVAPESVTRGEDAAVYVFLVNSNVYGGYTLCVESYGRTAETRTLELTEDTAERLELAPAARHRVTVSAGDTALTDVRIVSERFGVTAAAESDGSYLLPNGDYVLTAHAAGFRKAELRFTVAGADRALTLALEADKWDGTADESWYDAAAEQYTIYTTAELAGLAALVNRGVTFADKTVLLCADLDLGGARWTAIGSDTNRSFRGSFDGQGHTISGLCLDAPEVILDDYYEKYKLVWPGNAGLFGYTNGAVIENLTIGIVEFDLAALKEEYGDRLLETDANTLNCAGGAAAYAVNTTFRRVETQGTLTAAGNRVGGLAGEAKGCTFTACVNRAAVSGAYGVGGLAGQCDAATRFYACANHGDVSGWYWKYMENKTQHGVGGLAGLNTSSGAVSFEACYNTGAVRGNSMLGGLLGAGRAELLDCYNTGAVTITDDEVTVTAATTDADGNAVPAVMGVQDGLFAGGLVGYSALLAVNNSFSRAAVTDKSGKSCTANALIGAATACSAENCYFADGSDKYGTQANSLAAGTLGAAFRDGADGWPILSWESAESLYSVTFALSYDTQANAGRELTLTVNGQTVSGTQLTLPAGHYVWSAVQDGYESASGSFEVIGKAVEVPLALTAERYTLTVSTNASFTLSLNGETVEPQQSGDGELLYSLYNGDYTYVAAKPNHTAQRGEISVSFGDTALSAVLRSAPAYRAAFRVTCDGSLFYDWTLEITDADGLAYGSFSASETPELMDGTYRYRLTAPGCEPLDGEFTVSGGAVTVTAAMQTRQPSVWDGSADTSWYDGTKDSFVLYTAAELAGLAQLVNAGNTFKGKTVTLENDLDLGTGDWTAIGTYYSRPFSGTFDGNGHTVTFGGAFTSSNTEVLGLFGYTSGAALRNLILSGSCKVTQSYSAYTTAAVGALIGWAKDTTVENVSFRAALRVKLQTSSVCFASAGGLVGIMDDGAMTACNSTGSVVLIQGRTNQYPYAGGLAGQLGGSMTGCYSSAAVSAEGGYIARAGGLAGGKRSGGTAADNYAVGSVSSEGADTAYLSALIGDYEAGAANYYLSTLTAQGGTAKTADALRSEDFARTLGEHFRYVPGTYPMNIWETAAASLTVSRQPDRTEYSDLEAFDDTGMELTVTYANGASAVITSGWVVLNGASLAPGQTEVLVTYLGCTAAVPVTVTQTTHILTDADLSLALSAPRAGETGGEAVLTDAQRAVFAAETVWMQAGEPISGAFEADTYYYARVTLSILPRTDTLYAFPAQAQPAVEGAYEVLNAETAEDGKTLTFLVTWRRSDTLTDRAGHLYYEGIDDAKARPLADTITVTLNGEMLTAWTVRELETLALTGAGAEHGGFTGLPLYALLARSEGIDLLTSEGTVTLGGAVLTLGALRADAEVLLAYGKDGAPLDTLALSTTGGTVTEIAITAERAATCQVKFLPDAAAPEMELTVRDSHGNTVYAGAPGTVTLRSGEDYTYSAVTPGYSTVTGTVRGAGTVTLHMVAAWSGAYTEPERDETGAYLIASAENLAWFHRESTLVSLERAKELSGADVKLTADISMRGYDWTPLCPTESARTLFYANGLRCYCGGQFTGTFDGGGHTIYDLSLTWSRGTDNTTARMEAYGLIGYLRGGTVRDLGVEITIAVTDGTVNEGDWLCVGAIAGFAQTGALISGCRAAADISVTAGSGAAGFGCYVGGLVGAISSPLEQSAVENSYSTGTAVVNGSSCPALGGIAGSSRAGNSRIDRCWSNMSLTIRPAAETESGYLGGIVALVDGVSTSALPEVSYCFALNPVLDGGSAAVQAGRVVGRGDRFGNEGKYNYALETMQILHADTSGYDETDSGYRSGWGRDLAAADAVLKETYTNVLWNTREIVDEDGETDYEEVSIWTFPADSYPRLAWESAAEPAGFAVTVEDKDTGAAIAGLDGLHSGETTFTVANDKACVVLVRTGETYTRLTAVPTAEENTCSFTLNVTADTTVVVALKGDLNADGALNSDDVALAKRIAAGLETASAEQLLNLGAERITGLAALRVQRAAAGLYAFAW